MPAYNRGALFKALYVRSSKRISCLRALTEKYQEEKNNNFKGSINLNIYFMLQFRQLSSVIESRKHFKNGVSSKSLMSRGILIVTSLLLSISLSAHITIAEKTLQDTIQSSNSVVKEPVIIILQGGNCQVLGVVLKPMFTPSLNEGEKSFTLNLKYSLDKQGDYAVLSALIEKGRFIDQAGKTYEPSTTKMFGKTYYSVMCVVPEDLDVETLKYTLNEQIIELKDLEKLSQAFID